MTRPFDHDRFRHAIEFADAAERDRLTKLALGRLLALVSRPSRPGDVEQYEMCRAVIMGANEGRVPDYTPPQTHAAYEGARLERLRHPHLSEDK